MDDRRRALLLVVLVCAVAVAWLWLRRDGSPTAAGAPVAARPVAHASGAGTRPGPGVAAVEPAQLEMVEASWTDEMREVLPHTDWKEVSCNLRGLTFPGGWADRYLVVGVGGRSGLGQVEGDRMVMFVPPDMDEARLLAQEGYATGPNAHALDGEEWACFAPDVLLTQIHTVHGEGPPCSRGTYAMLPLTAQMVPVPRCGEPVRRETWIGEKELEALERFMEVSLFTHKGVSGTRMAYVLKDQDCVLDDHGDRATLTCVHRIDPSHEPWRRIDEERPQGLRPVMDPAVALDAVLREHGVMDCDDAGCQMDAVVEVALGAMEEGLTAPVPPRESAGWTDEQWEAWRFAHDRDWFQAYIRLSWVERSLAAAVMLEGEAPGLEGLPEEAFAAYDEAAAAMATHWPDKWGERVHPLDW